MKILSIGEVLIDLISTEEMKLKDAKKFEKHFGGSVANLVKNIANMNVESEIVSCVGDDANGFFLKEELERAGVVTKEVQVSQNQHTTLVVVSKSKASPEFFAMRAADKDIKFTEDIKNSIDSANIIHFSAFSLCGLPGRHEILKMAEYAKTKGKKISFEPNYRDVLWESTDGENGRKFMIEFMNLCDYIKPSLDDCEAIFGTMSEKEYINALWKLKVKNIILTLGKDGFIATDRTKFYTALPFAEKVLDTTGAGDAFWTGFYLGLAFNHDFKGSLLYANAMSAFKVAQVGFSKYPSKEELESIINEKHQSIKSVGVEEYIYI